MAQPLGVWSGRRYQIAIKEHCPSGNDLIKEYTSFVNGLIGGLVGLIYYPTTEEIYCAERGHTFDVDIDPEKVRHFAMSDEFIEMVREVAPELENEAVAAQKLALSNEPLAKR